MKNYSAEGIIINKREFQESDRIITILSKEFGKIEAVAKGSRKIISRKSSSLEILNLAKFSFAKGKSLDIMTECELQDSITEKILPRDYMYIFYFCELIDKSTIQTEDSENFYLQIYELRSLFVNYSKIVLLKLQIIILDELGAVPQMKYCQLSGKILSSGGYNSSILIGYTHNNEASSIEMVSTRILKIQDFIVQNSITECTKLSFNEDDFQKIFMIQNNWIELAIDRQIKSFKLINN